MNPETIYDALTTEYLSKPGLGYNERHMAEAAAEAAGIKNADLKVLERIVRQNFDPVNFTSMASDIAEALSGGFTVNGYRFKIYNLAHPDLPAQYIWWTPAECSEAFDTACAAQQGAISHATQLEAILEQQRLDSEQWEGSNAA